MYPKDYTVGFGLRLFAYLIDIYGIIVILSIYALFFSPTPGSFSVSLELGTLILILWLGYSYLKDGIYNGQSIGKMIFNLQVKDYRDRDMPCSLWQSFKRNIVLIIPFAIFFETYFIETNPEHMRWGDKIANTIVIKRDRGGNTKKIWICDYCHAEFDEKPECEKHELRCKIDHRRLPREIVYFCSKCGAIVGSDDIKCHQCGSLLAVDGAIIKKEIYE